MSITRIKLKFMVIVLRFIMRKVKKDSKIFKECVNLGVEIRNKLEEVK